MKKMILALSCLLLLFSYSCSQKPISVNVMSFNIRLDIAYDSLNSWPYRKEAATEIVLDKNIDILGVQEALSNQMEDLKNSLKGYVAVGVGRDDGAEKGEYSAIFYKTDKFKEIHSGTFWLSETPDVPGVKGWDAAYPRVATWAVLEDIPSGRRFFFVNTHLDHVGDRARIEGVTLMLQKAMEEAKGLPFIITGDFNSVMNSSVIQHVKAQTNPKILLAREVAKKKKEKIGTFHDYGRIPEEKREYIDYILVSDGADVENYEVIDDQLNSVYLSDHNPIWSHVVFP